MTGQKPPPLLPPEIIEARARDAARQRSEVQWSGRFGNMRPPMIGVLPDGSRLVSIGRTFSRFEPGATWHSILYSHLYSTLGAQWFSDQLNGPTETMHIIAKWFRNTTEIELDKSGAFSQGATAPTISSQLAFRSIAYDLLCIAHVNGVSGRLVQRLKSVELFEGARYELWVTACFLRAGFRIEFEDETDRRTTHCEFTATFPPNGARCSVEAKRRRRNNIDLPQVHRAKDYIQLDVQGLISGALRKHADHSRTIFIDVNMPPTEGAITSAPWLREFTKSKHILEMQPRYRRRDAPKAFLFITNHPYHYLTTEKPDPKYHFFVTSFNQPEYNDLSMDAIDRHAIQHLEHSINSHFEVPGDFDDIPSQFIPQA